jgi:hypothetical protein
VLFADNLYPHEMAEALIRAMTDDALVDAAAYLNLRRVKELSDRSRFKSIAETFYQEVAGK